MAGGHSQRINRSGGGNGQPQQTGQPQAPPQQVRMPPPLATGRDNIPRPTSGGFDGPGEPSRQPPRQNPFGPGIGYDPARPAAVNEKHITNTRVELPPSAYKLEGAGFEMPNELPLRPGLNSVGKAIQIRLNQFKVAQWPQDDVYQFDILIGNGAEKRGKVKAIWESKTCQDKLKSLWPGTWIWDGNKIAWCKGPVQEFRFMVDLDTEKGRPPRATPDQCYVMIRPTKRIRMVVLQAYLAKQIPFDDSLLEAINFLDHAMRKWPSEMYTCIKRSFFARGESTFTIDQCVVAMKGVYSSIRLCDPKSSIGAPTTGLAVNVDVANGTFWAAQDLVQAARNYCAGNQNRGGSYTVFRDQLLPVNINGKITQSEPFKLLRKMCKLKFTLKHRGKMENNKEYSVLSFTWDKLKEGLHAKNSTFPWTEKGKPERQISVYDYYRLKYHITIQHWYLPLVHTSRAGDIPMELCVIVPNQRYNFKLGPDQTANMIKFAVTRPKERLASIQHGIGMLKWSEDPNLREFGVKIDTNMTLTAARLLPPPEVQYDRAKATPGTSGRWDLRGKKFFLPNGEPLKSWGVAVVNSCMSEADVRNFMNVFIQTYIGHGGRIENKNPKIIMHGKGEELGTFAARARNETGNQAQMIPQIMFWVLPGRDSWMYERLKKNMECRFAMFSQMMNIAHVRKAQPQYCSNVCMKVNAKLGGTSCKVVNPKATFPRPTMIIGADVSHPGPGSPQASMAALTMSFDANACRYAAAVQTNGIRVEMITKQNLQTMMVPLFEQWIKQVGKGQGPSHIYYFRDGVSEGQYAHVINQEVTDMKTLLAERYGNGGANIKWTVIVAAKRHHIRFFPKDGDSQAGDRNGNPLPGTLVERDVTHPFENDFYLSSHAAIQGTARPTHYYVLLDEANVPVNELHKMVYTHCYQYMRSTTPVSLFPAVYYAHLASNRARAHENAPASEGPRGGQKFEEGRADRKQQEQSSQSGSTTVATEAKPLVPLGNPENSKMDVIEKIRTGMWYI